MDELLKKLLDSNVLTEDTRNEIKTTLETLIAEAKVQAEADARATVTAQLKEEWIKEREVLIEALDEKVTSFLQDELKELTEGIEQFRDQEAEYAEKLVEAKAQMSEQVKTDIAALVSNLNSFMEVRLTAEMEEFRESIDASLQNRFGQRVFEAFVDEFKTHYASDDSVEGKLTEAEQRLEEAEKKLMEAESRAAKLERASVLSQVLTPLQGRAREVMEAILQPVETSKLEESYKKYVDRVLRTTPTVTESATSEKETKVLAEAKTEPAKTVSKNGNLSEAKVDQVTKDTQTEQKQTLSEDVKQRLRGAAGILKG